MATSLLQTIKTNSGLGQTSAEELQALSAAAGRPVQTTTPMESGILGANPDQAKMAGSSANKLAALRTAIQGEKDLGTAQRTGGPRAAATAAEQSAMGKTKLLAGLTGNLDDRVQAIVQKKVLEGAQAAGAQSSLRVASSALQNYAPEQQQALVPLLEKLGAGTATPQDVLAINQAMGKTEVGQELSADQLKSQFMTGTQQLGAALASGAGDTVRVSDLDLESLGVGNKATIAAALGKTEEELGGMTANEFLLGMRAEKQKTATTTETLQKQANSPLLGAAERAQARAALRGAGATGVRTAEEAVEDLDAQVEEADLVDTGNGQSVSVGQALGDENLQSTVAAFLENPETAARIREQSPQFADWIEQNKEALAQKVAGVDAQSKQFAAIQTKNKELATVAGLGTIDDSLMKQWMPEWGKLSATEYQAVPFIQTLNSGSIDAGVRGGLLNTIKQLHSINPKYAADVANLGPNELRNLGLLDTQGQTNYMNYVKEVGALEEAPDRPGELLATMNLDPAGAQKLVSEIRRMEAAGMAAYDNPLAGALDPNGDGKVEWDGLKQRLLGIAGGGVKTLGQLASAGAKASNQFQPVAMGGQLGTPRAGSTDQAAFRVMQEAYGSDGDFTPEDVGKVINAIPPGNTALLDKVIHGLNQARSKGLGGGTGIDQLRQAGYGIAAARVRDPAFAGVDLEKFGHMMNRVGESGTVAGDEAKDLTESIARLNAKKGKGGDAFMNEFIDTELSSLNKLSDRIKKNTESKLNEVMADPEKRKNRGLLEQLVRSQLTIHGLPPETIGRTVDAIKSNPEVFAVGMANPAIGMIALARNPGIIKDITGGAVQDIRDVASTAVNVAGSAVNTTKNTTKKVLGY